MYTFEETKFLIQLRLPGVCAPLCIPRDYYESDYFHHSCFDIFITYLCVHIPVSGEGNGTPLQYSCLENPIGGGAW